MKRLSVVLATSITLTFPPLHAQVLTEWVETRSSAQANEIALGYPVPVPVDTPLPFDGFRTYAGLHARHQDLVATTTYVHPESIGTTRSGRTIWAYRLGDSDNLTVFGLPEPATLTNGGIHAREWQTPEVVTGILELMATHENDHHFYDYLRDNVNMIVIPSLNIDGFMQTQRTPALNYLQSDPDFPAGWPRDGRMRRKNMLDTDEDLFTTTDHLNGVDLNRNSNPYWSTNPGRSSSNVQSLVHHGAGPASEPEILALDAAAQLGPIERLRMYTDVHSFSMVHFWARNENDRFARQNEEVLNTFTNHHLAFPAGKWYAFVDRDSLTPNQGIGATDEYFTHTYQVPSWTLEVEPSGGQDFHAPLPGSGADYGGVSENGHDGFILPESEIRRVREELAQSFAATYYRQAGPPSIQSMRLVDTQSGAVVYEAEWDVVDDQTRSLYTNQLQALEISRSYDFWLSFNKPMRWRDDNEIVPFPGQPDSGLNVDASILVDNAPMSTIVEAGDWVNLPGGAPDGYMDYQDDAFKITFRFPSDQQNRDLVAGGADATLRLRTADMTGMRTDANPATIVDWQEGVWKNYEDSSGNESDFGGYDTTLSFQMTDQVVPPPFLLEPGITSAWYDPLHNGEGFLLEILANNVAVMYWFTYDELGAQDWYVSAGEIRGNRIEFSNMYRVSGGEFGPGFDPANITQEVIGSASFIWSGCDEGNMSYRIGPQHGRMDLVRITRLMGVDCGNVQLPPESEHGLLSGSWYDPTHNGEGYNVEVLVDGRAIVYWFSYDPDGNRRWFFGVGEYIEGKLVFDNMLTSKGGIFGPEFDPATVEFPAWGSLVLDIDCHGGTATYESTEEGFGSGVLNVVRLTNIDRLDCP
jgi:hypothetical protein